MSNGIIHLDQIAERRKINTLSPGKVMDLIVQDFEEINIERPQMVAKLLVNLRKYECGKF